MTTTHTHSTTKGNFLFTWDVERLWDLAGSLPPEFISIDDLLPQLNSTCWVSNVSMTRFTPNLVIEHARRILESEGDEVFPILLSEEGMIMDGMHRLCKAVLEKKARVKVVRFDVDPPPDRKEWNEVRLVPC